MQRSATAASVVFLLLVGAASFALVTTASPPHFDVQGRTLSANDTFTAGGQQYTVTNIQAPSSSGGGGGHGGGGGTSYQATIEWTNQSFQYTESWSNNSTVSFGNQNWTVLTGNGTPQGQFALREVVNQSQVLANDPNASNETVTYRGEPHVVVTRNGSEELVPASEYFPDPRTRRFSNGSTFDYNGNRTTVTAVTNSSVSVQWTAPSTQSVNVGQQANVTLGDQTYFAYFESGNSVTLSRNFDQLNQFNQETAQYNDFKRGLWGVVIVSGVVVILLLGMAFLPSRY